MSRVELRRELNSITMKHDEDTKRLFEQICSIANIYNWSNRQLAEEDLIAIVLDVAPDKFKAVLANEQRLQKRDGNIELKHLQEAMQEHYRSLYPNGGTAKDDKEEVTLNAFDGNCHN